MNPECIINCRCTIGEGPVWDDREQKLYHIDNRQGKVYCYDGKKNEEIATFTQKLGFIALRENESGLAVGLKDGFHLYDPATGQDTFVAPAEPGRTNGRFNDGKADPAGRLWGGTQSTDLDEGAEGKPDSGLYSLDETGTVTQLLDDVIQSNGLGWSADAKKFYFIDTMRYNVQEFDYDIEKNQLSNGRVCVEIPQALGVPDGMTVDDEGNIYVAIWGGYCVNKYDPKTGEVLDIIELPVPNVTSCCFGGENLDELYITTAAINTNLEHYPTAGGVYKVKLDVTGRPSYRFRG